MKIKVKSIINNLDTNILLLYYIILFIPEPFILFSVLCDYVTCDSDICDNHVTGIMHPSHPLSKFKIKKK